jgi:predicted RNA-binding protein YlqC (UPF0109 family)
MSDGSQVREFLDFVIGSVFAHPGEAHIDEIEGNKTIRFELTAHQDDIDYLNADDARVGHAIATMVDACAYKHHVRAEFALAAGGGNDDAGDQDEDDSDLEDDVDDDDDDDDDGEVGYDDEDE